MVPGDEGSGWGHPAMTARAGPGQEKVKPEKSTVIRGGSGLYIKITNKQTIVHAVYI